MTATGEIARKSIHVAATLGAAAVVLLLSPLNAAAVLAGATAVALTVEALRMVSPRLEQGFRSLFGSMLRRKEARRITGATTLAVGFTLAAVVLPGPAAMAGILSAGIGDAAAATVGRRWGRHRYPGGRSLEGSGALLAVVLVVGMALGLGPVAAFALGAAVTVLEGLPLPLDDNLYLPIVAAAVFHALGGGAGLAFFS